MCKKILCLLLFSFIFFILASLLVVIVKNSRSNVGRYYMDFNAQANNFTVVKHRELLGQPTNLVKLLAKKKIDVNFNSINDNLGIIAIPFNTYNKSVQDRIVFRLKEEGKKSWYYQSTYNANQIQNNIPFPFGFPIIKNSKNISYTFEIESLEGTPNDSLSISKVNNYFLLEYKFSKSELIKNPNQLLQFISDKMSEELSLLTFREFLLLLLFSIFFPLALYQIFKMIKKTDIPLVIAMYFARTLKFQKFLSISVFIKAVKSSFFIIIKRNSVKTHLFTFLQHNSTTILIMFLLVIVGTSDLYNNLYPALQPVGTVTRGFPKSFPSSDFYSSVYYRTEQMIHGKEMDISVLAPGEVDASGPLLPLLFSPFLAFSQPDRQVSYFFYLALVFALFILFFTLLMRKSDKTIFNGGLIFLIAFFLSEPGLLGIHQGNIDILIAPLAGILILLALRFMDKKSISIYQSIGFGIFAGSLVNIKITILPLVLSVILFSKRKVSVLVTTVITFIALVYIPNFYGSSSTLTSHISKILAWRSVHPLGLQLWANHSTYVIASFFSRCFEFNTCDTESVNTLVAWFIFLLTLITPFLLVKPVKNVTGLHDVFRSILKFQFSKEFILVLLALSVAFTNLPFKIIFDYRLYFSIPITLILLKEVAGIKNALAYCYLSMLSLLLGGIWVIRLAPNEFGTIDPRLLKIFFIFHFFFLILAALTNWKESQKKPAPIVSIGKTS